MTPPLPETRGRSLLRTALSLAAWVVVAGVLLAFLWTVWVAAFFDGMFISTHRHAAAHFLTGIASGLEDYRIDHGTCPLHPELPESTLPGSGGEAAADALAAAGSLVLYRHLSGDFDGDGEVDPGGEVYVERLDFRSNHQPENLGLPLKARSRALDGGFGVVDQNWGTD